GTCVPGDPTDVDAVTEAALAHRIDLAIVGPEAPLVAGIADALRAAGVPTLGPSKEAAQLEASKAFAKEICAAAGVPTAPAFHARDAAEAHAYVAARGAPIVVKADGLAAGKGVTVAQDLESAHAAVEAIFAGMHGRAEALIEAVLPGEEASFFVLTDGKTAVPLGSAQDHKRLGDGDVGPNTGGMGAYTPAPVVTAELAAAVMAEIVHPTLAELSRRGMPYQGVLFVGLMIDEGAPSVVEFNVRLGDPETQALMLRLGAQVLDLFHAAATASLAGHGPVWAEDHAMAVVLAAAGYPGAPRTGDVLEGLGPLAPRTEIFHAGTALRDDTLVSAGGRVLAAAARGGSLREARDLAYGALDKITLKDGQIRRDIGARVLGRR
ncbi:MAG: phosphoribosylamine--glycine ligase, partial [Pseudomonadota bacterium]